MNSPSRLSILLVRAWHKLITPPAQWLTNWQHKVGIKTRNRWVLTLVGLLFIYGLISFIALFF